MKMTEDQEFVLLQKLMVAALSAAPKEAFLQDERTGDYGIDADDMADRCCDLATEALEAFRSNYYGDE